MRTARGARAASLVRHVVYLKREVSRTTALTIVFAIVLITYERATQWTAWRLGFQPQLGRPWFESPGIPVYLPPAFGFEEAVGEPAIHGILRTVT